MTNNQLQEKVLERIEALSTTPWLFLKAKKDELKNPFPINKRAIYNLAKGKFKEVSEEQKTQLSNHFIIEEQNTTS